MKTPRKRKPPPMVLVDKLNGALAALSALGLTNDEQFGLLKRFRAGEIRHAVALPLGPSEGMTPRNVPLLKHVLAIQKLDEAWKGLYHYQQNDDLKAYLSPGVEEAAFRQRQQRFSKMRKKDEAPIVAHLVCIGYQKMSVGKKRARLDAAEIFKVSESHINGVIRRAGLQSPKKKMAKL